MCLLESNARAEHSIAIHFQELSFRASARVSNPMPSSNTPPIAIPDMANANTIKKCHSQTPQAPKNAARAGSSGATLITTTRTMSAAIKCQTPGRLQKRECRNHDRYCIRQRVNVPVPNWLACPVQCMSSAVQFPNWLLACLSSAVSPTGKGACPKLACLSSAVSLGPTGTESAYSPIGPFLLSKKTAARGSSAGRWRVGMRWLSLFRL